VTAFFDTNVLVYTVSTDRRKATARLLLGGGGLISVQVVNEFIYVARKKLRHSWPAIVIALAEFRAVFNAILPLTIDTHAQAVTLARDHGVSIYDALIVAAALEAGCSILYSEDMQDGRTFEGLTIRNPFRESAP